MLQAILCLRHLKIIEDTVQILLMLEVRFIQDSKFEDLFCGASSGSDPSLFFRNYHFGLGLKTFSITLLE